MKTFIYILILLCVAMLVPLASGADEPGDLKLSKDVAVKSLPDFSELVRKQGNFREMGFESADEVQKATVGAPLKIYIVRLDQLRKYEQGTKPESLLSDSRHYLYLLQVNNAVRSAVTVAETREGWKAVSFGKPTYARTVSKMRGTSADSPGATADLYVVQIPSFNLSFVGSRGEQGIMLTPVADDATFGFKAGAPMTADKVFEAVAPAARKHDGLPR